MILNAAFKQVASPADILRRESRVPSPRIRGEETRDARLTMSAGEAIKQVELLEIICTLHDWGTGWLSGSFLLLLSHE